MHQKKRDWEGFDPDLGGGLLLGNTKSAYVEEEERQKAKMIARQELYNSSQRFANKNTSIQQIKAASNFTPRPFHGPSASHKTL